MTESKQDIVLAPPPERTRLPPPVMVDLLVQGMVALRLGRRHARVLWSVQREADRIDAERMYVHEWCKSKFFQDWVRYRRDWFPSLWGLL